MPLQLNDYSWFHTYMHSLDHLIQARILCIDLFVNICISQPFLFHRSQFKRFFGWMVVVASYKWNIETAPCACWNWSACQQRTVSIFFHQRSLFNLPWYAPFSERNEQEAEGK
jgi:hypothetical protein